MTNEERDQLIAKLAPGYEACTREEADAYKADRRLCAALYLGTTSTRWDFDFWQGDQTPDRYIWLRKARTQADAQPLPAWDDLREGDVIEALGERAWRLTQRTTSPFGGALEWNAERIVDRTRGIIGSGWYSQFATRLISRGPGPRPAGLRGPFEIADELTISPTAPTRYGRIQQAMDLLEDGQISKDLALQLMESVEPKRLTFTQRNSSRNADCDAEVARQMQAHDVAFRERERVEVERIKAAWGAYEPGRNGLGSMACITRTKR